MGRLLAGAFMPHPPLIVPEVGAGHCEKVAATIEAMRTLSARLVALRPQTVVIISPHGQACGGEPTIALSSRLAGSMANFGAPGCRLAFAANLVLGAAIYEAAKAAGLPISKAGEGSPGEIELDSGAFVPLYYLQKAGFAGQIVHITPGLASLPQAVALGRAIAKAVAAGGEDVVFIGSGDLSHYLKDAPPYGLRPEGALFDAQVVEALKNNDLDRLLGLDKQLVARAGECGLRSLVSLLAAVPDFQSEFYSYEGSYGVGYAVAGWLQPKDGREAPIEVRLARWTLEQSLAKGDCPDRPPAWADALSGRAGVFVSLKKKGRLRGCIGTFLPQYHSLKDEIMHNALAAAFSDPRFPPLARAELAEVDISVDILSEPEQVADLSQLDAKKYGVIVAHGGRRGLLLPDLEGVESVAEQLAIAREKAGIFPDEKIDIYRFTVTRRHA